MLYVTSTISKSHVVIIEKLLIFEKFKELTSLTIVSQTSCK